jgi:predicted nicotinamide N-methyase
MSTGASIAPAPMADNREVTCILAGYGARLHSVPAGGGIIALWQVDDLERHVDRRTLLAADDAPEPPYWAHLWSGARVLADAVPPRSGRVVELGCGLGLPGLVAARHGARVTFVDRERAPLAFVRASALANGLGTADVVAADFTAGTLRGSFDIVLLAEVLYDRAAFPAVARAIAAALAPGGLALLADGARIDTRAFYPELGALGLRVETTSHRVQADGVTETIALCAIRWSRTDPRLRLGSERRANLRRPHSPATEVLLSDPRAETKSRLGLYRRYFSIFR